MRNGSFRAMLALVIVIVGLWGMQNQAWAGGYPIWRLSLSSQQVEGNDRSREADIAGVGRDVVFSSDATSLVAGDSNNAADIFRHDLQTRVTERVSIAHDGQQANQNSGHPAISFDGTVVAFHSAATNLIPNDQNGMNDIFVRDLLSNTIDRISEAPNGMDANAASRFPVMGGDGFQIGYESDATNLVAGDTNGVTDVFLWDNGTLLISAGLNGAPTNGSSHEPAISAYGNHIVFQSVATNLVEGDTNLQSDIFLFDRTTQQMELISVSSTGVQANNASSDAAISDDGRFVAFASFASNLVPNDTNSRNDIFLRDRLLGTTIRVATEIQPNGNSLTPVVASSGEGALVVFVSEANNLVPNDTNQRFDVFAYHNGTGTLRRVSETADGTSINGDSSEPTIAGDFIPIIFTSEASNLVPDDTNEASDLFVEDPVAPTAITLNSLHATPMTLPLLAGVVGMALLLASGVLLIRRRKQV